jgi:hypothetical protein
VAVPTGRNRFVARLLRRSQDLLVRADLAVEGSRHLRMQRFRQRSSTRPPVPDEAGDTRLRRELGPPAGDTGSA